MFGSQYLDTVIALALVFAAASTACSALFETFSAVLGLRGRFLKRTIEVMFAESEAQMVLNHASMKALKPGPCGFPSYIDPILFARVVYSEFVAPNADRKDVTSAIGVLKPFVETANSPSGVVTNIAGWFIACTDRT